MLHVKDYGEGDAKWISRNWPDLVRPGWPWQFGILLEVLYILSINNGDDKLMVSGLWSPESYSSWYWYPRLIALSIAFFPSSTHRQSNACPSIPSLIPLLIFSGIPPMAAVFLQAVVAERQQKQVPKFHSHEGCLLTQFSRLTASTWPFH